MMKLMEGMQLMQSQILDVRKAKEMEVVKSSVAELPKLADWKADSAPLDLTDWFLTIEPAMGDLSDGSQQWWDGMLRAARSWYAQHQEKTPLEKVSHKPEIPPELRELRYQRLEKRATALLMSAIPASQQEEVIAGKGVSTMNVLAKLMLSYQPGGLSEKSAILTALDSPEEAQTLSQAVTGLRKWLRWHRRAGEVGVVRPDATIQVKGLGRLMKKVLKDNADLAFRIQLAKSSLQIDTTPTEVSVMTYANHLLAEVEQIAHQDRKKKEEKPSSPDQKLKRIGEESKGEGKGGRAEKTTTCRFFCTEDGCRKGRSCLWSHVLDEKKRCWNCGSIHHFSPGCERPRDPPKEGGEKGGKAEGKGQKAIGKIAKKEEVKEETSVKEVAEPIAPTESVKELLEEANKMLKSLTVKGGSEEEKTKDERLAAMQAQLDEMRKIKVLRVSRISKQEVKYGLLDSGATHPMRGKKEMEDLKRCDEVKVSLADGSQATMHMTSKGVMVVDDPDVEPIVPLSYVVQKLGYNLSWSGEKMQLKHPWKTDIKVTMINGCPQISKKVALALIEELEKDDKVKKLEVERRDLDWFKDLTRFHPALKTLPEDVKEKLIVRPAEDLNGLPGCNRRRRKLLEREGFVVHLYAGEKDGYTLARALKECGGDRRRLVEIDVLRQEEGQKSHDMLDDGGPYPSLMRAALDGSLKGVIMGPNCRTRSVLRHYPLPVPGGGPRPVRSWEEPWGMERNTKEEQTKVYEDDCLMWRGLMLYIVREELRKGLNQMEEEKTHLGLEQPADPTGYMPEVVTFWKTPEWVQMKKRYSLQEQTFLQSRWGGLAKKPTTFAGTLRLTLPGAQEDEDQAEEKEDAKKVKSSKDLARWAPGMMREVAERLQEKVFKKKVRKLKRMTWEEHVKRGHCPFRRDCQVCQEASARGRMHRKILHPKAGVVNLDVAGPFHQGNDVEKKNAKFMLIGTYTWLRGEDCEEGEQEEVWEEPGRGNLDEEGEEGPEIEEVEIEGPQEEEEVEPGPEEEEQVEGQRPEEEVEGRKIPKIEVIRIGIPLSGKSKEVVLEGVAELYLQLRSDGFPVHTIHTDRGREFSNSRMKSWLRSRGIQHTMNGGQDAQANGRAERAVGEVKRMVRRLLHASGMASMWWPMALRYLMETARLIRKDEEKAIPGFGQKVLVKKRIWRQKALEPTHESSLYLTPVIESHGHCVLRQDGNWGVAPYVVKNVQQPPPPSDEMWLALLDEVEKDEVEERRRIRGKRPIRDGDPRRLLAIRQMLQEEASSIEMDVLENSVMTFKKMEPWKALLKKAEAEEEEILQTKIVSPQELVRDIDLWDSAIRSEVDSLFVQKEALKKVDEVEREELRKKGGKVIVLPSKLVITRKAGGRRKIRIVVCGNFAEKVEGESLYAGGSDTISLRICLKKAALAAWHGVSLDIKTAFLNAPLPEEDELGESVIILIKPPPLLVKLGYVPPQEVWLALKAIYGLRQSPKTWSDHRDLILSGMEWPLGDQVANFEQMVTDPNVWKIVTQSDLGEEQLQGVMIVYVDDLMVLAPEKIARSTIERIKEEWDVSTPEWLEEAKPTKFLGIEIRRKNSGFHLTQESYLKDLMKRNEEEGSLKSGLPITKEQSLRLEEEEVEKDVEKVRLAQKATGELMWLGCKTRPDLMYTLAKMAQGTLKNPSEVVNVGKQARKYLRKTEEEGIFIKGGTEDDLTVFTDSSYGYEAQGTVIVCWGGSPMMWKSGRQGVPALSTAESELIEAIEGVVMGDSVDVMIQELVQHPYVKVIKIDNQAAVNLLAEPSGSWRTRHLRLRAAHLRWRLSRADWMTEAIPGNDQLADIGTKVLTAPRLQELRKMMSMKEWEEKIQKEEKEDEVEENAQPSQHGAEGSPHLQVEDVAQILRVVMLLSGLHQVRAQEDEEEVDESINLDFIAVLIVVVFAAVGIFNVITEVIRLVQKKLSGDIKKNEEIQSGGEDAPLPGGDAPSHREGVHPQRGDARPASLGPGGMHPRKKKKEEPQSGGDDAPLPSGDAPSDREGVHPRCGDARPASLMPGGMHPQKEQEEKKDDAPCSSGDAPSQREGVHPQDGDARLATSRPGGMHSSNGSGDAPSNREGVHPQDGDARLAASRPGGMHPSKERSEASSSAGQRGEEAASRSPAILTEWGNRWHSSQHCGNLKNSKRMYASLWCNVCAKRDEGDKPIYFSGLGKLVHFDPDCSQLASHRRMLRKCQTCVDRRV